MNARFLKLFTIAIIVCAIIGSAVVCLHYFNSDHNDNPNNNARHYDEGDQIKSTIKWQDDSDVWHTGKYIFTVIDRGGHSLRANVTYTEGTNSLSQSIAVTETNGKVTATIEKFDETIEFEQTNGKYVYRDTYEIKDSDIVSRVFELTCNAFTSCGDGIYNVDPKVLFEKPGQLEERILIDSRALNGIWNVSEALYKDGVLHRSTIIDGTSIVCSEDPDLVKNYIGDGRCIEHTELKMAGTTWDCLKVTTIYDADTKHIRYYTVDGFLLLKSQIRYTTTHSLDSTSVV